MSDVVARAKAALETYSPTASQFHDDRFIGLMREVVPELVAEVERLRRLPIRLEAFARDCVTHGDMTPAAAYLLNRIAEEELP